METMSFDGLVLFYNADERDAAQLVRQASERSVQIIREQWGLDVPTDCRIYVMTSWASFIFQSAPWTWKPFLVLTMPLWYLRVRRTWKYAGGWAQRYGRRRAVGVKPPRLLQMADTSIGEHVFVEEHDLNKKLQQVTCHELTHAFAAHLQLPAWLNEGMAMVTVDRFAGKPTVKPETLEVLERSPAQASPGTHRRLSVKDEQALIYHVVRGYWITRYVEDTKPELLKSLLSERHSREALEGTLADAFGMRREEFWGTIDETLVCHFRGAG